MEDISVSFFLFIIPPSPGLARTPLAQSAKEGLAEEFFPSFSSEILKEILGKYCRVARKFLVVTSCSARKWFVPPTSPVRPEGPSLLTFIYRPRRPGGRLRIFFFSGFFEKLSCHRVRRLQRFTRVRFQVRRASVLDLDQVDGSAFSSVPSLYLFLNRLVLSSFLSSSTTSSLLFPTSSLNSFRGWSASHLAEEKVLSYFFF